MSTAILDSIVGRFRHLVGESRGLTLEQVDAVIAQAPTGGEPMKKLGLIDDIAMWSDFIDAWDEERRVDLGDYAQVPLEALGFEPEATFALVHGSGPVMVGEGRFGSRGGPVIASDTVARAILDAADDPEIDAIVFRVNSPGGSALASDIVWQAVERAKAKGKPVVASFSDVAASGGYYVAAGADRIVAQATTQTGSIGVFVIKPVLGGLLDKLGIGVESMTRGPHADLLLSSEAMDEETRAVLKDDIRGVYDLFLDRVSKGRGMSIDEVDALARGRVWTGEQARENGLVDVLGGLRTAAVEARKLVGIDDEAPVALVQYPKPRPLAQELAELLGAAAVEAWTPELPLPDTLASLVRLVRQLPQGAPLLVPSGWIEIH
jgi:protease-4